MDSLTAESHTETLAKVMPLLEEGRHEEALPFLELHKSKNDDPIWSYLMALSLACLARGDEGLPLLEQAAKSPDFSRHFGIPQEENALARTTALNHLMFETSVESTAIEPWVILHRYAELLSHREFQAKSLVGRMKLDPENPEVVEQFLTLFEDAPPDKVIPILDDVVNNKPHACQPRALLGSFLQQRGKTALAIRHLKTAAESDPNAMEPHLYLGKIYLSQQRYDDAEKELSDAMAKGKKPTVALLVEVANCQRATYRYEEALQTLFDAFDIHPPSFRHWDQLVDTSQNTGNAGKLVEALRRAADRFPEDARLRQRFAMVAFRQGEPLAARDQLRATGIFENPTKDTALARLASEVALALGEPGTAVHLVETLWKASPNSPETSRIYGDVLIADGRAQEAETLLRETAKNNPNDRALQISWGRSLLALGDAERAHRAFGLASRLDPDDPEAMAEQGRAMLLLGLHEEAQNVLKESAKKVDPPLAVTLTGLGAVYERKNLKDIARDFYRQALTRQSDRSDAARGMIRTRADDGSTTLALDVLELCSQLPTPFARLKLWITLLKAAFTEGCPKEARTLKDKVYPEVAKALSEGYQSFLENSEVRTLTKLAKDLEADGEPEKAREIWRYAVSSPLTELSQKASTELKRLDTYESPAALPLGGEDDPLMSLLSSTIPEDADESPLFASEVPRPSALAAEEADLFADESSTPAPAQDVPLFSDAETGRGGSEDDVLDALFAVDTPVQRTEEANAEDLEGDLFALEDPLPAASSEAGDELFLATEASQEPVAIPVPGPSSEPLTSHAPPDRAIENDLFDLESPLETGSSPEPVAAIDLPLSPTTAGVSADPTDGLFDLEPAATPEAATVDATDSLFALEPPATPEATPRATDSLLNLEPPEAVSLEQPAATPVPNGPATSEVPPGPADLEQDDLIGSLLAATTPDGAAALSQALSAEVAASPDQPVDQPSTAAPGEGRGEADSLELDSLPTSVATHAPVTLDVADQASPSPQQGQATQLPLSEAPQVGAAADSPPAAAEISAPATSQVVREELLPIPMAADFSPLTRRQLHYHEALASGGVVNPESLAHLLLQSVVGHEPPDPSSQQGASSVALLQRALVASALELENSQQFRAAVRVLRTALLYQPDSEEVLEALSRVQGRWAEWLVDKNEFAHAVSLLRDSLQRQPDNDAAAGQLEAHYHSWMDWSEASGDPAARDLLAVYLEQEQTALDSLRQAWDERKARTAAAPTASAAQAPPPVSPNMPATAPTSALAAEAAGPVAATPAASAAVAATPAAPPAAPAPVPASTVAAPVAPASIAPPAPAPAAPAVSEPPAVPTPSPSEVAQVPPVAAQAPAAPVAAMAEPAEPEPILPEPNLAVTEDSSAIVFDSKEEALETLDAAPDDDSVAEGVFAIYADSMRDLTTILKERSNAAPEQPAWLLLLARAFRRSGSETMAVIQYQKYIKVAPSPEAYEELAQTYEQLGKEDFAKMTRRKAERA
jgi:tetratricopeptide (TPR) repeat protein